MSKKREKFPEQKFFRFLDEGAMVKKSGKPERVDHSDRFGLAPEDFS